MLCRAPWRAVPTETDRRRQEDPITPSAGTSARFSLAKSNQFTARTIRITLTQIAECHSGEPQSGLDLLQYGRPARAMTSTLTGYYKCSGIMTKETAGALIVAQEPRLNGYQSTWALFFASNAAVSTAPWGRTSAKYAPSLWTSSPLRSILSKCSYLSETEYQT